MAIAKWIPFSSPHAASTSHDAKAQPIPVISPADAKKFGLENFGNTCYANSVLQALYFCTPFRELLLQYGDSLAPPPVPQPPLSPTPPAPPPIARWKPERKVSGGVPADASNTNGTAAPTAPTIPSSPPTLVAALRSLFLFISKNPADKGTVAPRAFIDKLKEANELFRSTMHQDAHEFLNYLLNKIVEEIEEERRQSVLAIAEDLANSVGTLSSKSQPTIVTAAPSSNSGVSPQTATLVHKLFEGVLTSETRCLTCETVSSRDEAFLDLSVDIEQNSSITACLRQFSASEMLCNKNKFFCDSCCDLQEAEKRMKIKNLPNILALHLKRFKYQEDVQKYIKLAYRVAFPLELRLFNTVDNTEDADRLFELFSIVIHIGNGPHHGHYISIVKTMGTWVVFDDDAVEQIKESEIPRYFGDSNAGSAYVLYYQAVDLNLSALGLQTVVQESLDQVLPSPQQPQLADSPQRAPALPPGLAEEGDLSDVSDPPFPVTPSVSSSPILEPPTRSAPPEAPTLTITSPDDTSASSPNPTSPSTSRKLFKSLRRLPSKVPSEQSPAEEIPRSRPSTASRRSEDWTSTISSLPPIRAGKEPEPQPEPQTKEPEGKVGAWFNRTVSKLDKSRRSLELSTTSRAFLQQEGEASSNGTSSSPTWYNSMGAAAGHETGPTINRLPSEPGMLESFNALSLQAPSTGSHLQLLPTQGHADQAPDSQSIGSVSSSAPSAEVMIIGPSSFHPPSLGHFPEHGSTSVSDSRSVGSPPSTSTSSGSAGPQVVFPSSTSSLPQQLSRPGSVSPTRSPGTPSSSAPAIPPRSPRRSQSQSAGLSSFAALDSPPPPPPARHPHRSQAHTLSRNITTHAGQSGQDKGNPRHSAPVLSRTQSAKPALPSSVNAHRTSHRMESPPPPVPLTPTAAVYTNGGPPGLRRGRGQDGPEDWHKSAGPETMTFAGANHSTSSAGSGSGTTSLKQTNRKLSLSGPMLGFGRKDKDKDKDKQKDREIEKTTGVKQRSRERERERERQRSQDTSAVHPWISFAHF